MLPIAVVKAIKLRTIPSNEESMIDEDSDSSVIVSLKIANGGGYIIISFPILKQTKTNS